MTELIIKAGRRNIRLATKLYSLLLEEGPLTADEIRTRLKEKYPKLKFLNVSGIQIGQVLRNPVFEKAEWHSNCWSWDAIPQTTD